MDIETILEEAEFLCARLDELDWSQTYEDFGNEYYGHVNPSHSRLKKWLGEIPIETAATGAWQRIGEFEPEPDGIYLVLGVQFMSIKRGTDIPNNAVSAALIKV